MPVDDLEHVVLRYVDIVFACDFLIVLFQINFQQTPKREKKKMYMSRVCPGNTKRVKVFFFLLFFLFKIDQRRVKLEYRDR